MPAALEDQLQKLREELEATSGPLRPGRRIPKALRERMRQAAGVCRQRGWSHQAVSEALGLGTDAVRRWYRQGVGWTVPSAVAPVVVEPSTVVVEAATLSITSPDGWRVEGLDLEMALALLARAR